MSRAALEAELTQIEAELARRSLSAFIEQAWHLIEPGQPYVAGWHIDAIAEHLEAVTTGQIQKLLITMPPRHMKSLAVSVFWPAWVWASRPSWRGVFTSYALNLAIRDSVKCRQIIESGWYRARWGTVFQLTGDQNQKMRFANNRHGERLTGAVDSGVTGEGGDVIVCDDPNNVKEAHSVVKRDEAIRWWDQVIPTRLNNPATGGLVMVMQRCHEDDLAGHWLKRDGVEHLNLPAEFESARRSITCLGWTDPRTVEGELLWPERFPLDILTELKIPLGSYGTAGQLQQRPSPAEGGMIKRAWWQFYDPTTIESLTLTSIVISVDPSAKSKETNDPAAFGAWGVRGADIFALKCAAHRWETPELIRQVRTLYDWCHETWPHVSIATIIENTAAGPDLIAALRRKVPGVMPEDPKGDKVQRVHAILPVLEAKNVWLPGRVRPDGHVDTAHSETPAWVDGFVEECAAFPVGTHDDQVDQMSQAVKRLHAPKMGAAYVDIPGL